MTPYTDMKFEKLLDESLINSEIDLDGKQLNDHDIDIVYKKGIIEKKLQTLAINNSTLRLLDLRSNNITDEGAEYLAEMLKINKTIIRLDLDFNQITDHGVQLLTYVITYYNENLQWLSLSSNKFISDKCLNILIEMLTLKT